VISLVGQGWPSAHRTSAPVAVRTISKAEKGERGERADRGWHNYLKLGEINRLTL